MYNTVHTRTPAEAKRILDAGGARASAFGIPCNIAVVYVGGALLAFTRQDGRLIRSIDLKEN